MPTEAPTEEAAPALSIAESCRKKYSARIPLKNQMNATNIGGASSDWWDISRIYYEYKATFKVDAANAPKPLATAFFDAATASGGLGAGYAKMTPSSRAG